jgi:quinol monooxygenase YgiN
VPVSPDADVGLHGHASKHAPRVDLGKRNGREGGWVATWSLVGCLPTSGSLMLITRREFVAIGLAATTHPARVISSNRETMYGLIGRMKAVPGQRDALISILLDGTGAMPGCRSYIIAKDPSDTDAIWITEAWADQASHQASLSLPSVQQAIARARPLIAGFAERFVTEPVGGHGLRSS